MALKLSQLMSDDVIVRTITDFVNFLPGDAIVVDAELTTARRVLHEGTNSGTWLNVTAQYSDGDHVYFNVKVSDRTPDAAESINDPYVHFNNLIHDNTPMEIGFVYNLDGQVTNGFTLAGARQRD